MKSISKLEENVAKLAVKSRRCIVQGLRDDALKATSKALSIQDEIIMATEIAVQLTTRMLAEQKDKRADIEAAIAHLNKTTNR